MRYRGKYLLVLFASVCLLLAACQTQPKNVEVLASGSSFTLINADTDTPISGFDPIPNGAVLNLQTLPTQNLNIRANVGTVGSVRFALDGDANYKTENSAPYALAGNNGSDYFAWTPSLGQHILTATAYSGANASGTVVSTVSINFNVVSGGPSSECSSLETQLYVNADTGSDSNPGTAIKPLKTLNEGLNKALANRGTGKGTCVLLQPGTYRESVGLYFSSSSSGKLIVIEAVDTGKAVISGSDVWTDWNNCSSGICERVWSEDWGTDPPQDGIDIKPVVRRREMILVNGTNLAQYMTKAELTPGSFMVDESANKIFVKPPSGVNLNQAKVEVAVRGVLFKAKRLDDLVLRGLVFQHAASPFDADAAVVLSAQKNVTLDGVTIKWNGQKGLWMGGDKANDNKYTLRNTTSTFNGAGGFEGYKLSDLTMVDTESSNNNWRGERGNYYTWSVEKFLLVHKATITRHKAVGNFSRGIWFDGDSTGIVIDGAYSCGNRSDGLHLEAVQGLVTVKNSTFCGNKEHGVNLNDSRNIILENNIISDNDGNAIEVGGSCRERTDFESGEKLNLCMANVTVRNNTISSKAPVIVSSSNQQKGVLWWLRLYDPLLTNFLSTSTFEGNTYSHSNTSDGKVFKINSGGRITFDQWKQQTRKDGTSRFIF